MTWTKTAPTDWTYPYWWRFAPGYEPQIVRIGDTCDGPWVYTLGQTQVRLRDLGGEWWPVPLTPPGEEE